MALGLAIMTFATSYLGYDKYEQSREPASVTVNVESMPANSHAHGAVLSRDSINAMIAAAIAGQHKADLIIFKQKEPWE